MFKQLLGRLTDFYIYVPGKMNRTDFCKPVNFLLAPPTGQGPLIYSCASCSTGMHFKTEIYQNISLPLFICHMIRYLQVLALICDKCPLSKC